MAGVAGSTDISGTNAAISGISDQLLNPVNTIVYNTGDVVSLISANVASTFAGTDAPYEVSLYKLNAGVANGSDKLWSKVVTFATGATGWVDFAVADEAIPGAVDGDVLAVHLSSRGAGGSGSVTFKQGATSSSKSHAASGASGPDPWAQTTTSTRQVALTVTTVSGAVDPIIADGTPTGVVGANPTLGFSTNTITGTARFVMDTPANISGITQEQVLAGDNNADAPAAEDSGNVTVSGTSVSTTAITGVPPGLYHVAAAQS